MNELYDLNKIKKDAEHSNIHNYHKGYEETLDIDNERVKEYMIK